jgi:hypothetical protein
MPAPITVMPRQDRVEALQFTGGPQSAWDLGHWIQSHAPDTSASRNVWIEYRQELNAPSMFRLAIGDDSYEMRRGDWIVKDGNLFSMVRSADFSLRYVTPIDKIKLEAGML